MEEMAVDVTGRFYRAMAAGREGVASTSSLYSEDSVRQLSCFLCPVPSPSSAAGIRKALKIMSSGLKCRF